MPPECPAELLARLGEDVLGRVEQQWAGARRELGPCLVWTGPRVTDRWGNTYG